MVDWDKSTGSSGTMKIRDTGTYVEFWLNSNNSSTFNHQLPWSWIDAAGASGNQTFDYNAGAGWQRLRSWLVTTDQTVTFKIGDTGTSGFGGPTSLSATIERATVPGAPYTPVTSNVTGTSITVSAQNPGSNGGAAITARQFARNTVNTTSSATLVRSDSSTSYTFTGLAVNTTYYFWCRVYNAKGWGPWSSVKSQKTLANPDTPDPVILSNATQTSFVVSFTDNGNGGSAILERQLTYNTVNTTGSGSPVTVNYTGVMTITGLQPATTYYVWARVRTAVGWSGYSPVMWVYTLAGAYVNVGGAWKQAIPYVRVGGVWKLARPWSRVAGVWKEAE
jgi:hypothetical protein